MRASTFAAFCSILLSPNAAEATLVTDQAAVAIGKEFDFVIVGAGLAGLTVANKLSAKNHSILIIEAGPDGSWNDAIRYAGALSWPPAFCNRNYSQYDENGNKMPRPIAAGGCIGGSTSINGMVWYRPTRAEIDRLETLGNPGWNWDTLEPLMEAMERNTPPTEEQVLQGASYDPDVHGYHGLVNTSFFTPMRIPKAIRWYKEALPAAFSGLRIGNDLSSRTSVVSASTSWTIWLETSTGRMRRSSAADALLWAPSQQRKTLTVLANHTVASILFDHGTTTARGVIFTDAASKDAHRNMYRVQAQKGVILAAGTLGTAPILERSGIGNPRILTAAKVHQLVDLPGVGANLNASAFDSICGINPSLTFTGPTWSNGVGIGRASSIAASLAQPSTLESRAQSLVNSGAAVNLEGARMILNTTIELILKMPIAEVVAASYPTSLYCPFWPLMPLSRGHIHIVSSDPFKEAVITPRFLTDVFDQQVAIATVRRIRNLFSDKVFDGIVEDAYHYPPLGRNATDSDYLEWLRDTADGASHWIGTTAMLPRALGGVVDSRLR
ncbi:GMC oxidoreductase [Cordyceps fumosorosea ARSEF 2679]|uniref:GMC oxidoreductase n=1 Tax=Cordyceps fumosorosea (strain ARSEF 2679) TaxID=1081104 RepID=A0A168D8T5_CORFA|nr:GMC oxidoreductase [Cordyceps fumosorosea ARSEF 2679]OAA72300.1 GMC oxidoreductase [Cordyceps fumosorosea ARSEF 2679]